MKLWSIKIALKIILSRLPINYRTWSRLGVFRHGSMDKYSYAWNILNLHASEIDTSQKWSGLEIGPGDSALSAILAHAINSKGFMLVDSGDFINKDIHYYKKQINDFLLKNHCDKLEKINEMKSLDDMLKGFNSEYFSKGIDSLKKINKSFNLIYSQAVLEHIDIKDFEPIMKECYRLLKQDGVMSHVIDFKDHLGGGLNNMRFSSSIWEKEWFAKRSGFYTNRIKLSSIVEVCTNIGFSVEIRYLKKWKNLPILRSKISAEFSNISNNDLLIKEAHLVMRK